MVDSLLRDMSHGVRALSRTPVYATVVVLTLAVGVGATGAVLNVMQQVLVKDLNVDRPEELVEIGCFNPMTTDGDCNVSYAGYQLYRENRAPLDDLFAYWTVGDLSVSRAGRSEIVSGLLASANMYSMLGLQPHVGRLLTAADDRPGAPLVAVLDYGYWQRAFNANPDVVGQPLQVNAEIATIVGVTPQSFRGVSFGSVPDVTLPLTAANRFRSPTALTNQSDTFLKVIGRRGSGVSDAQIESSLTPTFLRTNNMVLEALPARLAASVSAMVANYEFLLRSASSGGESQFRDDLDMPLRIVAALVIAIFLAACANLVALLISRLTARRRELVIRLALGETTGQLVRQLLVETGVVALVGSIGAIAISVWFAPLLVALLGGNEVSRALDVAVNAPLLALTVGGSVLTMTLITLGAALHTRRVGAVKMAHGRVEGARARLSFRVLVAAQCAIAVLLLMTAGLFVRTIANLQRFDLGFELENRVVASVRPGLAQYDAQTVRAYLDRLVSTLEAQPGIRAVSYSRHEMGALATTTVVVIEGFEQAPTEERITSWNRVGPGFIRAAGLELLVGRDIEARDALPETPGVVVNESFARHFFGGEIDVLGRQIGMPVDARYTIVGVVRDAQDRGLTEPSGRVVYLSYAPGSDLRSVAVTAQIDQDPTAAIATLSRVMATVDPSVPVQRVDTLASRLSESFRPQRLVGTLSTTLGVLAALLVSVGLYGILAEVVTRRRPEIALRMALGATRARVAWSLTRESLVTLVLGIAVGLAGAGAIARIADTLLFGVEGMEPLAVVVTFGVLGIASFAGMAMPLRRAVAIDPAIALRTE